MTPAEALADLNAEAATYPQAVRIWMGMMAASYFSRVVVAVIDRRALWIALAATLTFAGLIAFRMALPEMPRSVSGALLHVVLWPPTLAMLWQGHRHSTLSKVWAMWVSALMAVSLVLDIATLLLG